MKTKVNNYNIDLREVVIIGPLKTRNRGEGGSELGCAVEVRGLRETLWLTMSDDKIDPYQIDETKNSLARLNAQANYIDLVERWNKVE